jgi:hypothetical protein
MFPRTDPSEHIFTTEFDDGHRCSRCGNGKAWIEKDCVPVLHCTSERIADKAYPRWWHEETKFLRDADHGDHDCDYYECLNCGQEIRVEIDR